MKTNPGQRLWDMLYDRIVDDYHWPSPNGTYNTMKEIDCMLCGGKNVAELDETMSDLAQERADASRGYR